jgi:hypothetical protein
MEKFYCPHCESPTLGKEVCGNCGMIRPIDEIKGHFCSRCNQMTHGETFCTICGAGRGLEEGEVSKPMLIDRFPIQISTRLYLDPDLEKETQDLSDGLKTLHSEGRELFELEKRLDKEGEKKFDEMIEKKYSFDPEQLSDFEKVNLFVMGQEAGPHEILNQQAELLRSRIEFLIMPVREEITERINHFIQKISNVRTLRILNQRVGDRGQRFKIESNLKATGEILRRLIDFKNRVQKVTGASFDEIIAITKEIERSVNQIDFSVLEQEEIGQDHLRDFQEIIHGEPPKSNPIKVGDSLFKI